MNAHTLTRIADAITLERARAPNYKDRSQNRIPFGNDQLSRAGSAIADLRGGRAGDVQERGYRGHDPFALESEAMKHRLIRYVMTGLAVFLAALAFQFGTRWF